MDDSSRKFTAPADSCSKHRLVTCDDISRPPMDPERFDCSTSPVSAVMEHIVTAHHQKLLLEISELTTLIHSLASKQSTHIPWMHELLSIWNSFQNDMTEHIQKEQYRLFPTITAAIDSSGEHKRDAITLITIMKSEHRYAEYALKLIGDITSDFTASVDDDNEISSMMNRLNIFQKNFKQHIHLEDDFLYPRVLSCLHKQQMHN